MQKITNCLWFDNEAEQAVHFYTSLFKDSKIKTTARYDEEAAKTAGRPKGSVMTITFQLYGQDFMALNGGPVFKFSPAISLMVNCETQEEIDHLWTKLSEGGMTQQCGWVQDQYGISWQIVPAILGDLMKDPAKSANVMKALLQMTKLDIKTLKEAYEQQ